MNFQSLLRWLGVMFGGLLILGVVLGSVGLSQVDPALVVQRPTRRVQIPTPTLYPTLAPVTVPPSSTPGMPSDMTPGATPPTPTEEACPPPQGWQPYEVRAGDSIYTLAWAAQITANRLAQANCLTSMALQPGDIVYLPPIAFEPPATEEIEPCGPPAHWRIAYVQPGDTLYSLSVRYGTTVDAIRRANCMRVGDTLYAGQALYLPPEIVVWPTNTPTASPSWTPTSTPSLTPSATPTMVPPTSTPTSTPTVPVSLTPTQTPSPTSTITPPITVTATPPTSTPTPEAPTRTPSPLPSPTPTGTLFLTPPPTLGTATPSLTPMPPTSTPTQMPTPSPTLGTATPAPTFTLTPTPTSSALTPTPTPTATP